MDYQMSFQRRVYPRHSPVLHSGITKASPPKQSPSSHISKRWSMYDTSILYASLEAAQQQQQQQPRARPTSMYLPGTVSPGGYPVYSMPEQMMFSPSMPVQQAMGYSPTSYNYMLYPQQHQQSQQQQHIIYQSAAPAPIPMQQPTHYYIPYETTTFSTYDIAAPITVSVPISAPALTTTSSSTSPVLPTPLTPSHTTSASAPLVDDEYEGEILQGMGLYDKDGEEDGARADLAEARDSMSWLKRDCKRMLLLAEFEPVVGEEEEEEEEAEGEEEEVVQQQQQNVVMGTPFQESVGLCTWG